jgi:hypothetical protein
VDGARPGAIHFAPTPADFAAFQGALAKHAVAPEATLVVLSAPELLGCAGHHPAAGYVVSVVSSAQVHNYAKSLPRRSKTDGLDGQLLTQFARKRQPPAWTPPPAVYEEADSRE